jgi:hypothetical protein
MFSSRVRSLPYRFNLLLASLQLSESVPFSDALSQEQIQSVCDRHDVSFDKDVYTPAITLWGFLSQVIHKGENRSCLAAVLRIGKNVADGRSHMLHGQLGRVLSCAWAIANGGY